MAPLERAAAIERSLELAAERYDEVSLKVYERLFERHPAMRS